MSRPTARPTAAQRVLLDKLYETVVEREQLTQRFRQQIHACADAKITPAQIEKFAGVPRATARKTIARHGSPPNPDPLPHRATTIDNPQ